MFLLLWLTVLAVAFLGGFSAASPPAWRTDCRDIDALEFGVAVAVESAPFSGWGKLALPHPAKKKAAMTAAKTMRELNTRPR